MALKRNQETNIQIIAFAVIVGVAFVTGIIGTVLRNKPLTTENSDENIVEADELNGNSVVIQSENSYSAEGSTLPTDIDWNAILPASFSSDKLVGVVDNGQISSRNITLKFKFIGNKAELEQKVYDEFSNMRWNMTKKAEGSFTGTLDEKLMYLTLEQVDSQSLYTTLLINFPN